MPFNPFSHRFAYRLLPILALASPLAAFASLAPPQISITGESIDVRAVNVETVVTDKSGRRVHGLTAQDFRLRIDGREVPIDAFTEIGDGRSLAQGTGLPLGTGDVIARNYLVYIDDSYSLSSRRDVALDHLEGELDLLGPTDRMAILAFDGQKIDVLTAWTGDHDRLRAALAEARRRPTLGNRTWAYQDALARDVTWVKEAGAISGAPTGGLLGHAGSKAQRIIVGGGGASEAETMEEGGVGLALELMSHRTSPEARTQSGRTVDSMAATLRSFEAPAGRKVMFVLTGAWQMSVAPWLYGPILQAATSQGYAVYPVDTAQSKIDDVEAFDQLAQGTGGRMIVTARGDAFRQVVADSGSYYWLGFSPDWKGNDRDHSIVVEVKRPGLQVRSRHAFTDRSPRTEVTQKAESLLLFGGPKEGRRLIVELGAPKPRGRRSKELELSVTLGVPVEALALRPEGKGKTGYSAEVPFAIAAEDEKHQRADLPRVHLEVHIPELPRAGTYARFKTVLRLRNADQHLIFTVRDPETGEPLWGEAQLKPGDGTSLAGTQP